MDNKTAFVLSGGGAKGAFQAGVLYNLYNQGITPDIMYGTSVGSINSLGYSKLGPELLVDWWLDLGGRKEVLYPHGIQWLWAWHRVFHKDGIYSLSPLRKILNNVYKESEKVYCEAVACYVNLLSGKREYVSNRCGQEAFVDAVISSSTIPLAMETNHNCVDGGVQEHTPITRAIEDGYKNIYVILASPFNMEIPWKNTSKIFPWISALYRAVDDCMIYEIYNNDLKTHLNNPELNIHVYAPDRYWMSTLDFSPDKISNAVVAGINAEEYKI